MLKIPCPFCGDRYESEFAHGGPVKSRRPDSTSEIRDRDWVEYLTVPPNPIGPVEERWWHVRGCGSWFTLTRDTATHELLDKGEAD